MQRFAIWLIIFAFASIAFAQSPITVQTQENRNVVLAAVSRDGSLLTGGIGTGKKHVSGVLDVEPLAMLSASGEWAGFNCDAEHESGCRKFEKDYLSKPHEYTIVSADGFGATVKAAPTRLDECYGYAGSGTYSGGSINSTALAASSTDVFTTGSPAHRLTLKESEPIRRALSTFVPSKFDSTEWLRIYTVQLEGQSFFVVQRAFQDYGDKPGYETLRLKMIFAIGVMQGERFRILHWKEETDDENEVILGIIHLKSGRDFLITTVSDPESQSFRVYGIKSGQLTIVYAGGGSSC